MVALTGRCQGLSLTVEGLSLTVEFHQKVLTSSSRRSKSGQTEAKSSVFPLFCSIQKRFELMQNRKKSNKLYQRDTPLEKKSGKSIGIHMMQEELIQEN